MLLFGLLSLKLPEFLGLKKTPTTLVPIPIVEPPQFNYDTNPVEVAGGGIDAAFAGTATIVFDQTGALACNAALAATADITFGQTGNLLSSAVMAGTTPVVFGQTGALLSQSALAGTTTIVFGQSGDFVAGAASGDAVFVGSTTITFDQSGTLTAGAGTGGQATQASQMGGSGGWVPAHQIRWGKKNKKRSEQIEEVVEAIEQVAKVYPEFTPESDDDKHYIATMLLAKQTINKLREIVHANALAKLIDEAIEQDDEEILLLM